MNLISKDENLIEMLCLKCDIRRLMNDNSVFLPADKRRYLSHCIDWMRVYIKYLEGKMQTIHGLCANTVEMY